MKPAHAVSAALVVIAISVACGDGDPEPEIYTCDGFIAGVDAEKVASPLGADAAQAALVRRVLSATLDVITVIEADTGELIGGCRAVDPGADGVAAAEERKKKDGMSHVKAIDWCRGASAIISMPWSPIGSTTRGEPVLDRNERAIVSFAEEAACLASCAGAPCEAGKANCSKTLEVKCTGSCRSQSSVPVLCLGECDGDCDGSCIGAGGCDGYCDGACAVPLSADGSCIGQCSGACRSRLSGLKRCAAVCDGRCYGVCRPHNGSARCDGMCDGDAEAISCSGRLELPASCAVDKLCAASCRARAQAHAECIVPALIQNNGARYPMDGDHQRLLETALRARARSIPLRDAAMELNTALGEGFVRFDGQKQTLTCFIHLTKALVQAITNATDNDEAARALLAGIERR